MTELVAQCSNCVSWRLTPETGHATTSNVGFCSKGLYPDEGKPLCQKYEITHAFKEQIISTMMIEQGPMAMPVKLTGGKKSAREINKRLQKKHKR